MSWQRFYNLLVKHGGRLEQAGKQEMDQAGQDCPKTAEAHLEIALIYYTAVNRNENKQLHFL